MQLSNSNFVLFCMKYMGSKNRIAKEILPIILKDRKEGQYYVEPFCGGCNTIDKVDGNRIASDNNYYLIRLYESLLNGYNPIDFISREMFYEIKNNKESFDPELVALCGVLASYNGNWFRAYGGYSATKTGKDRNFYEEGLRGLLKQLPLLKDIQFKHSEYYNLEIPLNSIIYNDAPYDNVDKTYKEKNFDYNRYWNWLREKHQEGHQIFVSEYNAPDDFTCIWSKKLGKTHPNQQNQNIEKLFTLF